MGNRFRKYVTYSRNIYIVLISWILLTYISNGVEPYLPNYITILGGSEADIGWIYGVVMLIEVPLLLIGGVIGDYVGRRKPIVTLTSTIILAYLIYYFALNPICILLGMIIQTFTSLYRPSLIALISDSLKPGERGRGIIFIHTLPDLLAIPAPFIIGYIIEYYGGGVEGYKISFVIAVLLALIAFVFRGLYIEETLKIRHKEGLFNAVVKSFSLAKLWSITPAPMKRFIILRVLSHFSFGLYIRYLIRYAFVNGVTADLWGSIYSVATASGVFLSIAFMPYVDAIEHRIGLFISFMIRASGIFLFLFGGLPGFIVGLPLIFSGRALLIPLLRRYQIDSTPHEIRARVLSIDLIARNLSMSAGLFLSSLILIYSGENLFLPIILGGFTTLATAFAYLVYLPKLTRIEE